MAKSRIGPFALEAPLAKPDSSGQLFRAVHIQQRKMAALRIFSIPMGMTPESREDFASQLEQLKQLRDKAIVRCYGGGFDEKRAYLAHELIDGESLATQLKRRGRLPWETAFEYAQHMAEGLQYAHQMGWVHGRIHPGKLLITNEGNAKIGDWRRAAVASMIGGPPTIKHLQYIAPELLSGGAKPDEKSDLYAVGAVIYAMLTGRPPYPAQAGDTPQSLIQRVREEPAPRVSAEVLDCPIWLNAIVTQLLAKEPSQRPFSAAALQLAFKEAQRRQSEGAGVLQHATAGFSPLQLNVDRGEAEKVLGIKKKKKKRKQVEGSIFENVWVLSGALLLTVAAVVWFLLPLSEASLRQRAEGLLASQEWLDWNEARDEHLAALVHRFPESENADWAAEKIQWVDAREAERRIERDQRLGRTDGWSPDKIQYAEARKYEQFGDLATALDKFRAIVGLFEDEQGSEPILFLAREGIERIKEKGLGRSGLQAFLNAKLKDAEEAANAGRRTEAKLIWESIVELYEGNQEVASLVETAQQRLDELG